MHLNFINLQPYANPQYFLYLIIGLIPMIVGLYHGHRFKTYEAVFSLVFLFLIFDADKWQQGVSLIVYLVLELLLTYAYLYYRKVGKNKTWIFYLAVIAAIIPLILVKVQTAFPKAKIPGVLAFLGISYITFKTVQVIMEIRDGAIKEVSFSTYLRFLLFLPTFSSGPIDRYRRFAKDANSAPQRSQYLDDLNHAVRYLFQGFLYKFVLGWFFGTYWLPRLSKAALIAGTAHGGLKLSWSLVAYMYCYSMYLFFDFAGYSLFAVAISYFMGIHTPMNFNKPFSAPNIKEFWNRWHMTLSFWFRDYIYMRFTFFAMKKKLFKNPVRLSQVAYLLLFLVMGFWHGLTWYYIVYGIFHATAIIINDAWLRFKKRHKGLLPSNKFTHGLAIFTTFNVVCFSFLIFSGFLSQLWFGWM
ncbi:D-alanyl-lipoteichoic acid biosynthesis protein DltB [Lactobacillus sp. ESL0681]|uniref:D-alanyl-lipoteichoic acid biosynthesis protein DltB n=1 Tax=Lactobacillus sp. ESL0681 TaxID=2983211 RepID=UPI0023F8C2BE|nr:D-alanyl-lipoteichoic acid biosynthesis protein DltB [Lactobacillus sp. ESL0681]WEV39848.1 D-alanyl-lipoteichoic acid biosynthesis protein DltB [Lactobacillus sp. ESL0681]